MKQESEIKTSENLVKLASDMFSKMESAESDLEQRINEGNATVRLSPEKVEEIKNKPGIREKIAELKKKAGEIAKDKALVAALGMTMFVYAGLGNTEKAYAGEEIKDSKVVESVLDKKEINKENEYNKRIKELKESVWTDKSERSLVIYEKDNKEVSFEVEDCNSNFCYTPLDKLEEALAAGSKNVKAIHTHPLEAYPILENEIEEIKKGDVRAKPMPPSQTDMMGLIQESIYFKSTNYNFDNVENKVIDPTGEWTFKIGDNNNYFIKKFGMLIEKYNSSEFFDANLSEEEKNEIREKSDLINSAHPEYRGSYMPKRIADLLANDIMKEFPDKKWFDVIGENKYDYFKSFYEASKLAGKISENDKNKTEKENKLLIEKYISNCKKIGINVSYKPFEKNQ